MAIDTANERILNLLGDYLCFTPAAITPEEVQLYADNHRLSAEAAYTACLGRRLELNTAHPEDALLLQKALPGILRQHVPDTYLSDAYLQAILPVSGACGSIVLRQETLQPMELFIADDFRLDTKVGALPQLGWFPEPFRFPALFENDRVWMTVTPNEINTIRPAIEASHGKVLTYGLGLGYYAFHCLLKPEVTSVTVVERSQQVIDVFTHLLLPFFPHREKLRILQADAFDHAAHVAPGEAYDVVFTDIWRDVADGLPLYRRMKALAQAHPGPLYLYWMEPTLRCYCD